MVIRTFREVIATGVKHNGAFGFENEIIYPKNILQEHAKFHSRYPKNKMYSIQPIKKDKKR